MRTIDVRFMTSTFEISSCERAFGTTSWPHRPSSAAASNSKTSRTRQHCRHAHHTQPIGGQSVETAASNPCGTGTERWAMQFSQDAFADLGKARSYEAAISVYLGAVGDVGTEGRCWGDASGHPSSGGKDCPWYRDGYRICMTTSSSIKGHGPGTM